MYNKYIDIVNTRPKSKWFETQLREFENYLTPDFFLSKYPDSFDKQTTDWATFNVPELLAKLTHEAATDRGCSWEEVNDKKRKDKKNKAKNRINNELIFELTKEHLWNNGYYNEIELWFNEISLLLNMEVVEV